MAIGIGNSGLARISASLLCVVGLLGCCGESRLIVAEEPTTAGSSALSYKVISCELVLQCCDGACASRVRGHVETHFKITNAAEAPGELALTQQRLTRDPAFAEPQEEYVGWQDGTLYFPPNVPTEPTYDPNEPFDSLLEPWIARWSRERS